VAGVMAAWQGQWESGAVAGWRRRSEAGGALARSPRTPLVCEFGGLAAEHFGLTTHKYIRTFQLIPRGFHSRPHTAFGEWLRLLQCAVCCSGAAEATLANRPPRRALQFGAFCPCACALTLDRSNTPVHLTTPVGPGPCACALTLDRLWVERTGKSKSTFGSFQTCATTRPIIGRAKTAARER
jgi:hypothetical protein